MSTHKFNEYFTADYILSFGAIINFVLSDRSDGKSFDAKLQILKRFENDETVSIYMRRYKTEITQKLYQGFFDEIINTPGYEKYKDWKFKGSKQFVKCKRPQDKEYKIILYFVPLTTSGKLKSQFDITKIRLIIFDEYVPLDGKYISNEMTLLLEFWKSIDRDRDDTPLLILGNKITPFSPLLDYFGISLSIEKSKVRLYKDNTLAVQIYACDEHREKRKQSRFGKLISNTEYADYDVGGILNTLNFVTKRHDGGEYWASFYTIYGEGSIWIKDGYMIISSYKRKDGLLITDDTYPLNREIVLITHGRHKDIIRRFYHYNLLAFEDEKTYHIFEPIANKCKLY